MLRLRPATSRLSFVSRQTAGPLFLCPRLPLSQTRSYHEYTVEEPSRPPPPRRSLAGPILTGLLGLGVGMMLFGAYAFDLLTAPYHV